MTPIFIIVICFGIGRVFAAPAARSLPSSIVTAEDLPWLVARNSGTWQLAIVVGPVLGGFLYTFGVALPFVAMAMLLVVAAGAILFVSPEAARSDHLLEPTRPASTRRSRVCASSGASPC